MQLGRVCFGRSATSAIILLFVATVGFTFFAGPARGAPITIDFYNFYREWRSPNNAGWMEGTRIAIMVSVRPNPGLDPSNPDPDGQHTIVEARSLGDESKVSELPYLYFPAWPNLYSTSFEYRPEWMYPWELTVRNQEHQLSFTTHDISHTGHVELVRDMAITVVNGRPVFSWSLPEGAYHYVNVNIMDLDAPWEGPAAPMVHSEMFMPGDTTIYEVPELLSSDLLLEMNRNYSASVVVGLFGESGAMITRSNYFFNFNIKSGDVPTVFLPMIGEDGTFHFDVAVTEGEIIFIDPEVAVGYDYAVGFGNPNFASVLLPEVGDNLFDLYLFDGSAFVFEAVLEAGEEYFFEPGGVDIFRIQGIETWAGLDPADPIAFVTGLTFVADGVFTGTMTPITATQQPWTIVGFHRPVEMGLHNWNSVKAGATVPLKFEVFEGETELTDTSIIQSLDATPIPCDANFEESIMDVVASGGTSLRYDMASGQFVYNWKAPKQKGSCYTITLTTIDGSFVDARFLVK